MERGTIVSIEERIPKLKQMRKKKANRRLIGLLAFFFLLIICVLYFISPLSQIKHIVVKGNKYIHDEKIIELSGIQKNDSMWKVDKEKSVEKIKKFPEIKAASVKVTLPNTVEITVEEYKRVAYLVKDSKFYPVLSSGEILPVLKNGDIPVYAPVLIGFVKGLELNQIIEELDKLPEEISNSISEVYFEPKETDKYHIRIYMNDGYEVLASSRTLSEKLVHYPYIVNQLDPKVKGVIDLEVGSYFRAYGVEEPTLEGEEKTEGEQKNQEEGDEETNESDE
ncbi:cell division protein FtsQ/DivIB [Peribacillus alkalitolerans]|uniref:cell division protein FtsQ/DivIB n=1 Tax=Peribacillus alkalitolerans TaxID=1550385 RepID=UPI0013D509E1|nr:cell division protein FtsQ/DivIB [Peribacillus alkalitolerans]